MSATTSHKPADYALNHWLPHETNAEHRERVTAAEAYADGLWREAYAAICQRRDEALTTANTIRIRANIRRDAETQVALANVLRDQSADHHMASGGDDNSAELDHAWTALIDPTYAERIEGVRTIMQAAE